MRPFTYIPPPHLQPAHDDLCYLFQSGDAFCGIASNYSAMKEKMVCKSSNTPSNAQIIDCLDERTSETITRNKINRARSIGQKFNQLTAKQKHIAQLFFYEQQFNSELENYFGMGMKLILLTPSWQKVKQKINCIDSINPKHNINLMEHLKKEISELYLSVLESYGK